MFKTGLVSVSFRALSVDEIFDIAKKAGLDCIEWGSDVHAPCDNISNLEYIAKKQKEYGIYCSSYGTYFRIFENDISELESYIAAAKILGTDILRVWCGNKNYEDYTESEKNELISQCKEAAAIARKHKVKICLECHNKTYTNVLDGALELMSKVNSEHFCMYWQPNQFKSFETNCAYAEKIAKYVPVIHVFNWEGTDKFPLCEAIPVWQEYLKFFKGDEFLLLEFMPDNNPLSLEKEANALYDIIGGLK